MVSAANQGEVKTNTAFSDSQLLIRVEYKLAQPSVTAVIQGEMEASAALSDSWLSVGCHSWLSLRVKWKPVQPSVTGWESG